MIDIVCATAKDEAAVTALLAAQLGEHDIAFTAASLAHAMNGIFVDPSRGAILLLRDGEVAVGLAYVGFFWSLEHGGQSAWLDELYVVPERRAGGLGQRLLDEVIAFARANGCQAIDLEVEASHARAENLYARAGFQPHQRRRWVKRL